MSGLKTGMKNGMFWSVIGSGFGEPGGTPPPRIPRSTPGNGTIEFRVHVGTLGRSIVYSYTSVQGMQIVKKLKHSTCSAERKRKWENQAYIKHYPNLYFKEYYGIFRSGLLFTKGHSHL